MYNKDLKKALPVLIIGAGCNVKKNCISYRIETKVQASSIVFEKGGGDSSLIQNIDKQKKNHPTTMLRAWDAVYE